MPRREKKPAVSFGDTPMQPQQPRISSIDAVRALALLGILLVHSHDQFNIYFRTLPESPWDAATDWLYHNVLLAKAFLVFSFLFGLSFALQMQRSATRGIDFRGRFCWRLVLLALFGMVHSFFYCGDILLIFAVTGFVLVAVWKVRTRYIAGAAALCFAQPLALYNYVAGQPEVLFEWYEHVCRSLGMPGAPACATATFAEMGTWNVTCGVVHSFLYMVYTYRVWALLGFFLTGIVAGRMRVFERGSNLLLRIGLVGAGGYVIALLFFHGWGEAHGMRTVARLWVNEAYVFMVVPWGAWLLTRPALSWLSQMLQPIGRCTLTCYISQSVIMLWLICHYGMGWGPYLSTSAYMGVGATLYLLQLAACHVWLRHFKYGPLEGIWRKLTRLGM